MLNERDFIRIIREQPHEDHPRVVYADWLEARGEVERAELIRLHCGLVWPPGAAEKPAHRTRADELLRAHGPAWGRDAAACLGLDTHGGTDSLPDGETGLVWRRGFIDAAAVPIQVAIARLPELVRAPNVALTRVRASDRVPRLEDGQWLWLTEFAARANPGAVVHSLPASVWRRCGRARYDDRETAETALSQALLRHAWDTEIRTP